MPVTFSDIEDAFLFTEGDESAEAFLNTKTGETYLRSGFADIDELPEDADESEDYVRLPNKRDLDLGARLVMAFAGDEIPDHYDEIDRIFSRKRQGDGEGVARMVRGGGDRVGGVRGGSAAFTQDDCRSNSRRPGHGSHHEQRLDRTGSGRIRSPPIVAEFNQRRRVVEDFDDHAYLSAKRSLLLSILQQRHRARQGSGLGFRDIG